MSAPAGPRRILVTGATGYLGGAVARALAGAGHQVTAVARSAAARDHLEALGYRVSEAALEQPEALAAAAREAGAVVHAAAAHGPEARTRDTIRVIDEGRNQWTLVHLDDLADLYLRALDAPPGSVLHGATEPSYRVCDMALAASFAAGREGALDSWTFDAAGAELGPLARGLAVDQRISARRTMALTGWRPSRPSIIEELLLGSYRAWTGEPAAIRLGGW